MAFQFPPRPEKAVSPDLIQYYEDRGWWAQLKKNGTLQVITVDPDGGVTFKTRHNEPNKAWKPTENIINHFAFNKDTVIVGELLHSKHASVKDTIYLFDILRFEGKSLVGRTTAERVDLLNNEIPGLLSSAGKVVHAQWHRKNLFSLFNSLTDPLDEGLVLKDPDAKLVPTFKADSNSGSMVKVRKAHKNYGF